MGEVNKLFCELCKAEITPPTFSRPDASGETHFYFGIDKEEGHTVDVVSLEVCATCYDKLMVWARAKQKAAATAWKTEPPAVSTVKMPTI